MQLSVITVALILAIFTFIVVAVFGLGSGAGRQPSTRLLAAFLLALAASLLNFLYVVSGWVEIAPRYALLGNSLGLATAPLLYLYACSLAISGFRLRPASLAHFLPAAGVVALVLAAYTFQADGVQRAILHDPGYPSVLNSLPLQLGIFAYVFAYLFLAGRVLVRHRALYRQQQASTGTAELTWLRLSLAGTVLLAAIGLVHALAVRRWPVGGLDNAFVAVEAAASFALGLYFLVQALRQAARPPAPVVLPGPAGDMEDKYGPHRLSDAELQAFAGQVDACLRESGAHLQGSISIGDLADRLPMSARDLSQTLNRHFRMSFFDYINRHRCEHAQRLLADRPAATVAEIQYECGFSSKSSFYAAFRKCTGMTPVEYRRRQQAAGATAPPPS
ncbi:MAG: helix-turn-helix domain-containing protein [Rhizobium sp.]|nr:helix-turn-helix domain-containing protein [Rhizobium sp.]